MDKRKSVFAMLVVFALGVTLGAYGAKKRGVDPGAWEGRTAQEAHDELMSIGKGLLDKDDTWERIHMARVHLVSGDTEGAEAVFDEFLTVKTGSGNLVRIARAYAHNGDWESAKPIYDRVLDQSPKDEDWLAEAGAFYNLNGDRETAEELFARAFEQDPKDYGNILTAAGSYVGVPPRRR